MSVTAIALTVVFLPIIIFLGIFIFSKNGKESEENDETDNSRIRKIKGGKS